jgi:acyl carrier protein
MNDPRPEIRKFLAKRVRSRDILDDDEDIFENGFVNSLLAVELITFVERQFGVVVDNEDLDFANFRSVNAIATLIGRKVAAR